jgi:hypothetical protein
MNATVRTFATHPKLSRGGPALQPPELRMIEVKRRRARLHLLTYLVGNALFGRSGARSRSQPTAGTGGRSSPLRAGQWC